MSNHKNKQNHYNLIVIGGGAAGMMAAISARRHSPSKDLNIAIIDRTFALGRKVLVSGAGRCNLTNVNLKNSPDQYYSGAEPEFVKGVFQKFGYSEIKKFFLDLGIETYEEKKNNTGKVFPITNQAKTVVALLEDELKRNKIDIYLNHHCQEIKKQDDKFLLKVKEQEKSGKIIKKKSFQAEKVILAAGGKTYPALGSDGSGFALAECLGHTIVKPVPSALPLVGKNELSQALQGAKMEVEVESFIKGKKVGRSIGEVMFRKYGLSGPAIFNISREISIYFWRELAESSGMILKDADVELSLNFFPGKDKQGVHKLLNKRWQKRPDQALVTSLYGLFPNKIARALLKVNDFELKRQVKDLSQAEQDRLVKVLTETKIKITGTRGWNEAEFTAGGVDTKEINSKTLESNLINGLYFAGEIMNVDGKVGGYNLSWSWSTGYIVGKMAS